MQWSHITLAETEGAAAESGGGVSRRPYVRKRYTDTRHPTKELPDVRIEISPSEEPEEIPSVCNPPYRRTKSNQSLGANGGQVGEMAETGEREGGESPRNSVTDRPSYKRWQARPLSASKSTLTTDGNY